MFSDRYPNRVNSKIPSYGGSVPGVLMVATFLVLLLVTSGPVRAHTSDDVQHAESDRDGALARVRDVQDQLESALEEYDRVHTELEDVEQRIELTQRQIQVHTEGTEELAELARAAVIEAYVGGGASDLTLPLGAGTFEDVILARVVGERLRTQQATDLNRLLIVSREIQRLNTALERDRATISALASRAEDAAESVQASLDTAQHEVIHAEQDYQGIKAEFEEAQRKKREAEVARIRASKNRSVRGLPAAATEGFVCPVQGGAAFIDSWGFPRSGGRTHKGVDMFATRGTPTPAVTDGTIKIRSVNLGGAVTYLYGDDGNKYYYAHLNGYPDGLRDGQRVARGQAIGFVGNSGNAEGTSPHLHFEIRPGGGSAVNPYPTVRPACP